MQPTYRFYIGKLDRDVYFIPGVTINSEGKYVVSDNAHFAFGTQKIDSDVVAIYPNIRTIYKASTIVFYDEDENFISSFLISDYNYRPIPVPEGATRIGAQFTMVEENMYNAYKNDVQFIYLLSNLDPNYSKLEKKYKKESGWEFFRSSLEGQITLYGDDYRRVAGSNIEDSLLLIVDKVINGSWVEYYRGTFSKTDCKIDYQKKKVELKTEVLDDYKTILDKMDNTYDLIKLAPAVSPIWMYKRSMVQFYIPGSSTVTCQRGGNYWEVDANEVIEDTDKLFIYYRFSHSKTCNELTVRGAGIESVNGVYAGINGSWKSDTFLYECYADLSNYDNGCYLYIKDLATGLNIYRSSAKIVMPNPPTKSDERYLPDDADVTMVNLSDSSDTFKIEDIFVSHIYARIIAAVDSITDDTGTTYPLSDIPSDDFVSDNGSFKKCMGFMASNIYCSSFAVDSPTRYGVNDNRKYFTPKFISAPSYVEHITPICKSTWVNSSMWYDWTDADVHTEELYRKRFLLKDAYKLSDVVRVLVSQIDPTITHEGLPEYSQFLYGDVSPIGLQKVDLYMSQKSNVLKGEYDQAAQKAEITLEDVFAMLRDCYRVYWYIEDGKLKFEHISFFLNGGSYLSEPVVQFDLTTSRDKYNKIPISFFQSDIEFDKENLSSRYEFGWMEDSTEVFGGVTSDVKSNYVKKDKTEQINISGFSSDVDFMMSHPSSFSSDGFALFCGVATDDGVEVPIVSASVFDSDGVRYTTYAQNYYASWSYLINMYRYDMPAAVMKCSTMGAIYAAGVKRCLTQSIRFPMLEELNTTGLIKTNTGEGVVDEISVDMINNIAKVKLVYTPV